MSFKILVVDDQLGVRRLLQEAFNDPDYDVILAASGFEAVERVKEEEPDLIIMDMKMPGMSGLEALKQIKTFKDTAKVILMTAYGELEIVAEAMSLGIREYVTKPFDINELRQVVKLTLTEGAVPNLGANF